MNERVKIKRKKERRKKERDRGRKGEIQNHYIFIPGPDGGIASPGTKNPS